MATTPIGTIQGVAAAADAMAKPLAMQGWLYCDGTAVSRRAYSQLFAVIGTAWGAGDNSTTFNLPDLRGLLLRGRDQNANNDPDHSTRTPLKPGGNAGNMIGSVQPAATAMPTNSLTLTTAGDHAHVFPSHEHFSRSASVGSHYQNSDDTTSSTATAGGHQHSMTSGGDAQSRPVNLYQDFIISFQ